MCIVYKEKTEISKVENHKENRIVQDTKELEKYVGVSWLLTVNGSLADIPDNPYLMMCWSSFVEVEKNSHCKTHCIRG